MGASWVREGRDRRYRLVEPRPYMRSHKERREQRRRNRATYRMLQELFR